MWQAIPKNKRVMVPCTKTAGKRSIEASALALLLTVAVVFAPPASGSTQIMKAKIIQVSDGDSVIALDQKNKRIKVRLANIDAPETSQGRCRPGQPWSTQSKAFLERAVNGRSVVLRCNTTDRYGRSVCDILVDGTTASRMLTSAGLAWANRSHPSYLRDAVVATGERDALRGRKGLWADSKSIPPWEWRKTKWGSVPGCIK